MKVERSNSKNEALRRNITRETRKKFKLDLLKDDSTVRAYRDLFWALNIDPTKTRPSGEALLRRVLRGGEVPCISSVVDAYNMASLRTIIPLSGFDLDRLSPPLTVRMSKNDEKFQAIGMEILACLGKEMLVLADTKRILCIYPHRDAEATKITRKTSNVVIVGYGAPNISEGQILDAVETALSFINRTSGGRAEKASVFRANKVNY